MLDILVVQASHTRIQTCGSFTPDLLRLPLATLETTTSTLHQQIIHVLRSHLYDFIDETRNFRLLQTFYNTQIEPFNTHIRRLKAEPNTHANILNRDFRKSQTSAHYGAYTPTALVILQDSPI